MRPPAFAPGDATVRPFSVCSAQRWNAEPSSGAGTPTIRAAPSPVSTSSRTLRGIASRPVHASSCGLSVRSSAVSCAPRALNASASGAARVPWPRRCRRPVGGGAVSGCDPATATADGSVGAGGVATPAGNGARAPEAWAAGAAGSIAARHSWIVIATAVTQASPHTASTSRPRRAARLRSVLGMGLFVGTGVMVSSRATSGPGPSGRALPSG